jgi:hypothetical protein
MTFAWEQTSGSNITLASTDSLSANFTAPDTAGTLGFTFTATDDFGVATSMSISVIVEDVAPVFLPVPLTSSNSGGGAIWFINILLLLTLVRRLKITNSTQYKDIER